MIKLVNRHKRIYYIGTAEIWGSMMIWDAKVWLQPKNRGQRWVLYFTGEELPGRTEEGIYTSKRIRQRVENELGIKLSEAEWEAMSWRKELEEQA